MGILDFLKKKNKKAETDDAAKNTCEKADKTESSDSVLKVVMNESIPGVQDQNNNPIFVRDYKNRRVVLSGNGYGNLVKNNDLNKCVEYLKNASKADYITLYWIVNGVTKMVNLNLNKRDVYFVPMNYDSDDYIPDISDNSVHYTVAAAKISVEAENKVIESNGKIMRFCAVKNQKSGEQYLPLFKTIGELRLIFPQEKYRICRMTYEEAVQFGREFSGIVYRPTEENLILLSDEACLFASISQFVKPYVDYKKFTAGEKTVQEKLKMLQSINKETEDFNRYYRGILQNIYDLDKIYAALNPEETDIEEGMGIPILSKKDGKPALYLFSDANIADQWAEHYNHKAADGTKLIGVLSKKDKFSSLFSIASRLGIDMCMFDEGASMLGFSINLFMDVNNMDKSINLRMTKEEADELMNNNSDKKSIWFNKVPLIGMEDKVQKDYYELRMK